MGPGLLQLAPRLSALKQSPRARGGKGDGMEKMGADEPRTASREKAAGNQGRVVFLQIAKTLRAVEESSCSFACRNESFFLQLSTGLHRARCFPTRRQFPLQRARQRQRPLRASTWAPGCVPRRGCELCSDPAGSRIRPRLSAVINLPVSQREGCVGRGGERDGEKWGLL